jgi:hypothetical protein
LKIGNKRKETPWQIEFQATATTASAVRIAAIKAAARWATVQTMLAASTGATMGSAWAASISVGKMAPEALLAVASARLGAAMAQTASRLIEGVMRKETGNRSNTRNAYRDSQGDGQKGFGANDAGGLSGELKPRPQQVSNRAYKDQQSSGQKGFGTFQKLWW